ncbi:hypothetical protein GGR50DRAFT_687065 [Xylaria sp. CBS 124048]|nr:hypothetical protein GGR50DRAFT_687065 [Xylaria sp. CBS 124048]
MRDPKRIDGETPSIPSSQVFHTSTGLRAVDPTEAHRLNPYQNIGRLAVGHVVFRLVGGEYKAVGIESISQTKESLIDRVYTLSLAGERRTYHAHGYLVDMNAPTQATTEIVDLLRKVPGSKRLGLLSRCQEMWPMFKKFEGQCLHQRLNWELFGKKPVGVPIERLARGFSLKPRHPGRLPVGYKLPKLSMIDGYLLVDDQVQLRSKYDPHTRCFRWTRELRKPGLLRRGLFEHGTIGIHPDAVSGTGVVYLSADPEALTTPSRDQVHPFEAHARGLDRLHVSESEDQDTWNPFGQYKVTLDQSVWPPDTDRTEPETPVDGGTMEDGTMLSPHGVTTYLVQFPLIDQLREQINTKFNQKLGTFYQVSGKYVDGLQSFTVAFEKAPLVPFVSDAGVDITKKFNVGFNSKLGIDVTLPTLFKQMTFTLDVNYHSFSGYFFEYDPSKRGYKGDRHLITGTLVDSSAAEQGRAKISSAYASISNPSMPVGMSEKLEPAPVTHNLLLLKDPSIKDLMTFSGYDERDYGPAFICRYVGKTQKYAPKFTEKEIKNLWYWFEGNGKNSLSQSEEYNDINRLSSRSAMLTLYDKNLEPYLTNNPDKWADDLCDQLLGDRHQMMVFINNPIPDGNNVVNKQCNILDALSASADRAKKYFDGFMDFAWQQGAQTADIEGGDQDQEYLWIYDAMNQLVVAILEGSADISDEVRQALMEDINDFEIANGLNQQLDAEQRAAAILEKTSIFTRELAGWMSSIGKGLAAAFGGTALFKWAGQAFDSVAAKYSNLLPGVDKLKGLSSLCMVGVSLATAAVSIWGLVNNWNSMSDAGRATVIIQVVGMAVDAAGKAVDAFKSFKSKPSSTPTDEINTEALNDSLSDVVTNNTEKVGDLAQTIAGDEEYRTAMGEGLHGDGTMAQSNPEESWNEKLTDPAADVPPGYEEAAKKFNLSGNILKVLNVILGIGLVMAMSFSLAHDWSSMNDTGKALGVLNIVVQGLTVLLDIIDLGEAVGLYAVTGTMSVALPILGAVLAVIGIVLMVVQFFISLFVARQEPPDPIQDFVDDVGHALIKNFDEAPDPQLQYSISQTQVQGGDTPVFQIEGVNNSSEDVTLSHVTITLYSGDDDVCLFAETTDVIQLVKESDQNHDSVGYTYVTPSSVAAAQLPYPAKLGNTSNYYEYDLQVAGPPMEAATGLQALVLKQSDKFQSVWTAVINMPGDDAEKSTSWVEVVEVGLNDKTQQQFMLKRV